MRTIAFLNSYTQGVSGGDLRFIEIMRRLNYMGTVDLTVVTSQHGEDFCRERDLNAVFKLTTRETKTGNVVLLYARRIISALSLSFNGNTDTLLYSTSDFLPDVFPAFMLKLRHKDFKWVALFHLISSNPFYGSDQQYLKHKKIRKPTLDAFLYKITQLLGIMLMKWKADKILVVNSEISRYLSSKFNINRTRITKINNGVDIASITKIKQSEEIKNYDACFVGRFHKQKGLLELIAIWELVCRKKPEAKLALIGSGAETFWYKVKSEILAKKLTGNVFMLGFLNEQEKILTLKSSKLFLLPSTYESWGIVVGEAMACGLPVVAFDLPIFKDIFPKGMIRVVIGDTKEFVNQILNLLNNQQLYKITVKDAMDIALKYDWGKIAETELRILEALFD